MTGDARLQELASIWKSKLDWSFEVAEGAFLDPDSRVGLVFGVAPTKVLSFGKVPYSQTRYRFTAAAQGGMMAAERTSTSEGDTRC